MSVSVIGGGLVGALQSIYLRNQGYQVHLYEVCSDMRNSGNDGARSINLTMSTRARSALSKLGLDDEIFNRSLPMYARRIHNLDGSTFDVKYSNSNDAIWSIRRTELNRILLSRAEEAGVQLHFEHQLTGIEYGDTDCEMNFKLKGQDGPGITETTGFVFGCDGAYSAVRSSMSRALNFSQEYIPHGYKELEMLPTEDNEFALSHKHLHIWPRNEFMLLAMPNLNKSFTVTLFMPREKFKQLRSEDEVEQFFKKHFPDALSLIGTEKFLKDYFANPVGSLISIKSSPYHYKNAVLLGDAAHAMVPFYGQGMNTGFEDCMRFDSLLTQSNKDLLAASEAFSALRQKEGECICDLAMYNYIELRSHMNSTQFLVKRKIEFLLNKYFPQHVFPLYPTVAFTLMPYTEILKQVQKQDRLFSWLFSATNLVMSAGGAACCIAMLFGTVQSYYWWA